MKRSRIPLLFQNADLARCDESIQQWAEHHTWDLIIEGETGRGKTYAACAAMLSMAPDTGCLFCEFRDVLNEILDAHYEGTSTAAVVGRYTGVPVLCIDDFGKANPTPRMLETLHSIIDKRINNGKVTIYTTQYVGKSLVDRLMTPTDEETGKAIVSRLCTAERVLLDGEDRRLTWTA